MVSCISGSRLQRCFSSSVKRNHPPLSLHTARIRRPECVSAILFKFIGHSVASKICNTGNPVAQLELFLMNVIKFRALSANKVSAGPQMSGCTRSSVSGAH